MIKIKPYTELPQKEEIFNLYLYLASKAMPFYPEDVFLEGYCFIKVKENHGAEQKAIRVF